jgi:hypothetical protein
MAEAEEALARAHERGHPEAAHDLAVLREHHPSPAGIEPVADAADRVPEVTSAVAPLPEPIPEPAETGAVAEHSSDSREKRRPAGALGIKLRRRWRAIGLGVLAVGIAFAVATGLAGKSTRAQPSSIVTDAQEIAPTATHTTPPPATPAPASPRKSAVAHQPAQAKTPAKPKVVRNKTAPPKKPGTSTTTHPATDTTARIQPVHPVSVSTPPVHTTAPAPTAPRIPTITPAPATPPAPTTKPGGSSNRGGTGRGSGATENTTGAGGGGTGTVSGGG